MSARQTIWYTRLFVVAVLAALFVLGAAASASAATFNPLNVISYDTWRASSSMSQADIQAFLAAQPGALDSIVTTNYAGVKQPASQIIAEAAKGWNLNPKVILATLQKEQSLIALPNPSAKRLMEAMGCGVYTGSKQRYPGFGNQVWNGARKLSTYEVTYSWVPGLAKQVTAYTPLGKKSISIVPANSCTYALYTYTPYYPQKLFWDVYVRYFGDPLCAPRVLPVYRLLDNRTQQYIYTSSETERYKTTARAWNPYRFLGVAFTIDTSATANCYSLYRLQNAKTGAWTYTVQRAVYEQALTKSPKLWIDKGVVAKVSTVATAAPVYRLEHKKTHAMYLTPSLATRIKLTKGASARYIDRGVLFRLASSKPKATPIGPSVKAADFAALALEPHFVP